MHDAATLSASGHFVVLKQTARHAHVHDIFNVSQLKKSATPKIDSLESDADSLGNRDESSGLENAEPGTDQPHLPPDELHRVLEQSAHEPCQP